MYVRILNLKVKRAMKKDEEIIDKLVRITYKAESLFKSDHT